MEKREKKVTKGVICQPIKPYEDWNIEYKI